MTLINFTFLSLYHDFREDCRHIESDVRKGAYMIIYLPRSYVPNLQKQPRAKHPTYFCPTINMGFGNDRRLFFTEPWNNPKRVLVWPVKLINIFLFNCVVLMPFCSVSNIFVYFP